LVDNLSGQISGLTVTITSATNTPLGGWPIYTDFAITALLDRLRRWLGRARRGLRRGLGRARWGRLQRRRRPSGALELRRLNPSSVCTARGRFPCLSAHVGRSCS
jgi:hypothetical protein